MKVVCPVCKGSGKRYEINWLSAVFSGGLTALMDLSNPDPCPCCGGRGYIEERNERWEN